ncbi:MAG: FkbM family methyltransferase [Thermoguttaceae bacterium]|nr:FkbM family methyltransferase [Thermoguttaceae bacterium]
MNNEFEELLKKKLKECVDKFNPSLVIDPPLSLNEEPITFLSLLVNSARYSKRQIIKCVRAVNIFIKKTLIDCCPFYQNKVINKALAKIDLDAHAQTYDLLSDEFSKQTFVDVIALRLWGPRKVQMPQGKKSFYNSIDVVDTLKVENCSKIPYFWWELCIYDLNKIGKNYRVYTTRESVYMDWKSPQYEYFDKVRIKEGDYVVDGGACYGNTAIDFAYTVKENGKVYSFEFLPENLQIFNKNLELNSELASRIEIIPHPLWSNSSLELYVIDNGPGTRVLSTPPEKYDLKVASKSIDDLVDEGVIKRVDFLKLDIEGAELECLKGSAKTIQRWKPQLAVCVYHKHEDFIQIPQYLHNLVPEYKFYMKHHSDCIFETVLYAATD